VVKVPSLNCSTTTIEPSDRVKTVKKRLKRSLAQSFPQVPESVRTTRVGTVVLSCRRRRVYQSGQVSGCKIVVANSIGNIQGD